MWLSGTLFRTPLPVEALKIDISAIALRKKRPNCSGSWGEGLRLIEPFI
jgi:hypothetical protein